MTNTTSVEGDRLEQAARIIYRLMGFEYNDPWDAAIERRQRMGMEPILREQQLDCLEAARQIAALPCKGGEDWKPTEEWLAEAIHNGENHASGYDIPWHAETESERRFTREVARHVLAATPTTEPDTGRGLREALEALLKWFGKYPYYKPSPDHLDEVVADLKEARDALSSPPHGGRILEEKQEDMASRGPSSTPQSGRPQEAPTPTGDA